MPHLKSSHPPLSPAKTRRNIAILVIIAEVLFCWRSLARVHKLNQWPHYGNRCGFPAIRLLPHCVNIDTADSFDIFIKRMEVILWDVVANGRGSRDKFAPFGGVGIRDDWQIGTWNPALDVGVPLEQKFSKFSPSVGFIGAAIDPPGENAAAKATTQNSGSKRKVRDGYQWWVYVLGFLLGLLATAWPAIPVYIKEKREQK